MKTYKLPPNNGSTNLETLFAGLGITVFVDYFFRNVLKRLDQRWSTPLFKFTLIEKPAGEELDPSTLANIKGSERQDMVYSFLSGLAGDFRHLLDIPKGEEEVNMVCGWVEDLEMVLFVEHEIENDVEEIHLHARPPETLQKAKAKVVHFV